MEIKFCFKIPETPFYVNFNDAKIIVKLKWPVVGIYIAHKNLALYNITVYE
jgi:hypothetical protein